MHVRKALDLMADGNLVLIIGGTSDIGFATARRYAANGWRVCIAARDEAAARRNAEDIATRTRHPVEVLKLDVLDSASLQAFVGRLPNLPDTVVCVVGLLGEQARAEAEIEQATLIMRTNYEGPALLLGLFAEAFARRGSGTIVGVSSVAGDRGRASNYVYGSAKAGFTAFLSGLRNRLARKGVHVVTVKPGFVKTRMTAELVLPQWLTANPEEVATAIYRAETGAVDVVYVRPIWLFIMLIISLLPERAFKRLKL
jgi:decaprenylphospho-beta-D-erythro-pentofuranosid-2-ulose 2-reductase